MKMFVYGTLKRGFGLANWMKGAKYIGNAKLAGYKMYTNHNYPAIVKGDSIDDVVSGEVFEVEKDVFESISGMERGAGYGIDEVDVMTDEKVLLDIPAFVMRQSQVENDRWSLVKDGNFKL